jgi:hypothetical protein
MNHQVTRRMTTTTTTPTTTAKMKMTNKINGSATDDRLLSSAYAKREVVENGKHHHRISETTHDSRPGTRRRRRKCTSICISGHRKSFSIGFGKLERHPARYWRRNPEEVYVLVTIILGASLCFCWLFSVVLQKQQQSISPGDIGILHDLENEDPPPALHLGSDWNPSRRSRKKGPFHKRGKEELPPRYGPRVTDSTANVLRGSPPSDLPSHLTASFDIVFAYDTKTTGFLADTHWKVPSMAIDHEKEGKKVDFGGLYIETLQKDESGSYRRKIYYDSWWMTNDIPPTPPDLENDYYYAFDDDRLRNEDLNDEEGKHCRRISEHRINFPTCNIFHEMQPTENHVQYLRYVQVFMNTVG